jgi:ABC-2 type transport system permease protein
MLSSAVAIGTGAAAIGEDEDAGLLELTLAHGVTRTQVVLERSLALLLRMSFLMAVIYAGVLALNGPSELGLDAGTLFQAVAQFLLLVLLGGTAALLGGAVGGHRTHGTAAGSLVAVGGYVLNALGNQGEDLKWMHAFSPYHWALGGQPVANGVDWIAFWGLAGLNVLFVALAVFALRRRDVGGA